MLKMFENLNEEKFKMHGILFPPNIRCIIVGPSNCGKTNVMINLLEHKNGLKFHNVYVYSKSLMQPKYKYLETLLSPIKDIGYYTYSGSDKVRFNTVSYLYAITCTYTMSHQKLIDHYNMSYYFE